MFNLMIFNVDWESGKVSIPLARVLEYTEDHIKDEYRDDNRRPLLDKLKALPCIFGIEGTEDEVAYVGQIINARFSGTSISLEVSFDRDIPPLQNEMLYDQSSQLGIDSFEFSRNHWAVKEVDLYRFLLCNTKARRQRPTVFNLPEHENIDPTLASAMMPFDAGFTAVYASIKKAALNAGFDCKRADDIWEHASIIQDVVSLIDQSKVVICDCSGRNPNVFYEAGIAHTLGREVILITQSEYDIPFDLRHLRYIKYLNNSEGLAALTRSLQSRMRTIIDRE